MALKWLLTHCSLKKSIELLKMWKLITINAFIIIKNSLEKPLVLYYLFLKCLLPKNYNICMITMNNVTIYPCELKHSQQKIKEKHLKDFSNTSHCCAHILIMCVIHDVKQHRFYYKYSKTHCFLVHFSFCNDLVSYHFLYLREKFIVE